TTGAASGTLGGNIIAGTTAIDVVGGTITGGILNRGLISGNIKLGTVSNNIIKLSSGSTIISTATLTNTTRYNLGNGIGGLVTFGSVITGNYNNGTVAFASTGAITSTNIGVLEVDVLNATAAGKVTISG